MNHHQGLETVDVEAYSILTQFYEYDRDVPLAAKVFERESLRLQPREDRLSWCARWFHSWIPSHAGNRLTPYPCVLLVHGLGASREDW
jgi:hypothetical protein